MWARLRLPFPLQRLDPGQSAVRQKIKHGAAAGGDKGKFVFNIEFFDRGQSVAAAIVTAHGLSLRATAGSVAIFAVLDNL